jgi:hypothetical protein
MHQIVGETIVIIDDYYFFHSIVLKN